ncbi:hypothetical protein [Oceanobacillus salinisoli]|uniref:hypothetical protein n=1 Tax=Oceanobacillus salinisoli TaxID=2678611 RepID=UPI0012E221EC|nr:hypothetical protein [Oceanobacillus salinisoli]
MSHRIRPIVCPPKYVVRDRFVPRIQPIIQPVVKVDRLNVIDVPRHIVRPFRKRVVVDPRIPRRFY